eukprot:COSAG01_NODE_3211_length_6414_cov_7.800475_8_plen_76_part_00
MVVRLLVLLIMIILQSPLGWFADKVAHPLRAHPDVMLVMVMAGCPLAMNIIQMWVQDTFLKYRLRVISIPTGILD